MPLPKLDVPQYEVTLPSGTRIVYRAFLVKEEKLFLMASQSTDTDTIVTTVKQVLSNCIVEGPPIDEFPIFDVEYLLLHIRARSVGETVELSYRCNAPIPQSDGSTAVCGTKSTYTVDLLNIKPTTHPDHQKIVMLTNTVGVTMRYPLFGTFSRALLEELKTDDALDIILSCIENIFDEQSVHYAKDIPKSELLDFIETLTPQQLQKLDRFFETLPKNDITIPFDCPSCHHTETIVAKGIDNFFV